MMRSQSDARLAVQAQNRAQGKAPRLRLQGWDYTSPGWYFRQNIRRYIEQNPENYVVVEGCGEPLSLGNKTLMKLPKVAFLASRGEAALHGQLPRKAGEVVVSGFLSPMERAVLRACLRHKRPAIWIATTCRGDTDALSPEYRAAIEADREQEIIYL